MQKNQNRLKAPDRSQTFYPVLIETKIGGKMIAWLYPAIEKSYALEAWVLAVHGLSAIRISASALTCT